MRTIKFRAKRLDNGEWIYGDYHHRAGNVHCIIKMEPDDNGKVCYIVHQVNAETVGQFTGMHDKNDKEIYEGDIVKWVMAQMIVNEDGGYAEYHSDEIGAVEWCNEALYVGEYCAIGFEYESEDYAEVLGNIHDNPDLLNE